MDDREDVAVADGRLAGPRIGIGGGHGFPDDLQRLDVAGRVRGGVDQFAGAFPRLVDLAVEVAVVVPGVGLLDALAVLLGEPVGRVEEVVAEVVEGVSGAHHGARDGHDGAAWRGVLAAFAPAVS